MAHKKWATPLIAVMAVACGDAVGVRTANDVAVPQLTAAIAVVDGVQIDTVWVVVGGAKLETAGVDGTVDQTFTESQVVRGTVSGGVARADVSLDVAAGTYKEVEVSIDKLEVGKPEEEALLDEHPMLADASFAIQGRVVDAGLTESFTFTVAIDRDLEIKLDPFRVVEAGAPVTVRLKLNTAGWFLDAQGNVLDPRDLANRSTIEANIQVSLQALVLP
jgi:hypothetical protein